MQLIAVVHAVHTERDSALVKTLSLRAVYLPRIHGTDREVT
ncbi:hypothetical protein [Streptomyces sp. UNOB3_S3]|nr:hypothetical protein [Streptomyces sp. UNOB3_S3]